MLLIRNTSYNKDINRLKEKGWKMGCLANRSKILNSGPTCPPQPKFRSIFGPFTELTTFSMDEIQIS